MKQPTNSTVFVLQRKTHEKIPTASNSLYVQDWQLPVVSVADDWQTRVQNTVPKPNKVQYVQKREKLICQKYLVKTNRFYLDDRKKT